MSEDWTEVSMCAQKSTTAGAADFVLEATGYVGGFNPIPSSWDGKIINYFAQNIANNEREEGSGVYAHGTLTISRTTIHASTNSGAKVTFTNYPIIGVGFSSYHAALIDTLINFSGSTPGFISPCPTGFSDPGVPGQEGWDGTYIWKCVATDTWVKYIVQRS